MAGFREFLTGEVLTAANVDDFLAKQSVMKFADAAARDTALGTAVVSPNALREGMVAYLDSTDEVIKYDGSAWSSVGEASKLVEVKSAIFTGTQTASVSTATVAVTDLTITHALADASNKLIISAFIGALGTSLGLGSVGMAIHDGSGLIAIANADGARVRMTAGGPTDGGGGTGGAQAEVVKSPSITFVHEPGDTTSRTYTVRVLNVVSLSTVTLFINRTQDDSNTGNRPRTASGFVIQEVRA